MSEIDFKNLKKPTQEEIAGLKEGDEVLVKTVCCKDKIGLYASGTEGLVDVVAILPRPQQECECGAVAIEHCPIHGISGELQMGKSLSPAKPEVKFNPQSMDAQVWAKEFMRLFGKSLSQIDEGLMISWFANAIMAGFDEANRRHDKKAKPAEKGIEELELKSLLWDYLMDCLAIHHQVKNRKFGSISEAQEYYQKIICHLNSGAK